jgi:DNA-binding transcriptional regulator YdaS (Cro superfamily)
MKEALEKAVCVVSSQSELARRLAKLTNRPVRQGHVWKWIRAGRVPPDMAIPVEKATDGKVTRHELRPDLYPIDSAPHTSEAEAVPTPGDGYRQVGGPAEAPPPCDEVGREGVA